ncbi:MAG: hypothetical protein R2867_06700 [Caldilineaceae bacterium]
MLHRFRSIHRILIALVMSFGLIVPAQPVFAADTEIAHLWRFTYQRSPDTGTLEIMIVEHDKYTHEVIQVFEEFTYIVPCGSNGLTITCALDIKSAIQDSYLQMDLKEQAEKVRSGESYRWMLVEATGRWASIPANAHPNLVSHPSLQFSFNTNANKAVQFIDSWNNLTSTSAVFKPHLGQSHTMIHDFDCSQPTICEVTNSVLINGRVTELGTQQTNVPTVGFQLAPSQIEFTPPSGFQLDSFVIDPPKAGYG